MHAYEKESHFYSCLDTGFSTDLFHSFDADVRSYWAIRDFSRAATALDARDDDARDATSRDFRHDLGRLILAFAGDCLDSWTLRCSSGHATPKKRGAAHMMPNKSPEPTAVGACGSAIAVHVASRRWLSFLR